MNENMKEDKRKNGSVPERQQENRRRSPGKGKNGRRNSSGHERINRTASQHAAPASEERLRAQRMTAVSRKKRRKKNRILFYLIVFIFILVAGITLSLTVFFNIETITVDGNSKYSSDQIIGASGISVGNNLFRINCTSAERSILAAFGYLDQVTIDRNFPGGLTIHVTEGIPKFSAAGDQGYTYISDAGRILETAAQNAADGSIVVNGFDLKDSKAGDFINEESNQTMQVVQNIMDASAALSLGGISRISADSVVDIRIFLARNIRIDIGSSTDMEYKLTFAKKILDEELGQTDTGIIDVKQPGKAYFRSSESPDQQP